MRLNYDPRQTKMMRSCLRVKGMQEKIKEKRLALERERKLIEIQME